MRLERLALEIPVECDVIRHVKLCVTMRHGSTLSAPTGESKRSRLGPVVVQLVALDVEPVLLAR